MHGRQQHVHQRSILLPRTTVPLQALPHDGVARAGNKVLLQRLSQGLFLIPAARRITLSVPLCALVSDWCIGFLPGVSFVYTIGMCVLVIVISV